MVTEKEIREEIKRKLNGYNSREHERRQLEAQLERLEASMTAPRVQALDGMPKGPGGGDAMTEVVAELIDLQERYREKLAQLVTAQAEVESMIEGLAPTERRLMRHRYLEGMVWEEVCVAMAYSWRQIHRIHGQILDKLVAAAME